MDEPADITTLRAELRAQIEEFNVTHKTSTRTQALKDISDLKPDLLRALKQILNSGAEGNRTKVAIWGYDKLLEQEKLNTDPLKELLHNMPAPKAKSVVQAPAPDG